MASRLMGSALDVHGFNYFRIDAPDIAKSRSPLPAFGAYRQILDLDEWDRLMAAHDVSHTRAH